MDKKTQQETLLNCVHALDQLHFQGVDLELGLSIKQALGQVHDALASELRETETEVKDGLL